MKAVCLLSGGLDSTTALFAAIKEGYYPLCLTLNYGQLHAKEIDCAKRIADELMLRHEVIELDLPWKGSALLDETVEIPENRVEKEIKSGIPSTYVPARNTIFLSTALSWAEVEGARAIFIGANSLDYSGYPDCRPEYFTAMNKAFRLATKCGIEGEAVEIVAPLLDKSKGEIVEMGKMLGVPFEYTWSCYCGGEHPCLECDACILREKGFREAGLTDPLLASMGRK